MSSKKFGDSSKRRKFKPSGFEEWGGYMAAKKMKLGDQFAGRKAIELIGETETEIFKGISIFVNGYTKPPADELKRLMLIHGGNYHHYYSRSHTTHVIASNLPKSKMKDLKTKVIVTANWVTDSIKEGKLLSYQKYLLYTPEVIDKQTRLEMENYLKGKSESSSAKQNSPNKSCNKLLNLNEISENNLSSNFKLKTTNHVIPVSKQNVSTYPMSESKQKATADEASVSPQKGSIAVKAGHPEFLTEFYNNSRLHHISTAGQELKRYVQYLVENNTEKYFPKREKLKEMSQQKLHPHDSSWFTSEVYTSVKNKEKHVMHLDMDCFFVSVGLKKHPELKGVPVAVTHSKGKRGGPQDGSDINYEASFYTNESKKRINGLISSKNNETSDNDQEKPKISMYSKEYGSLSEIASCSYEARKAGVHNGMFLGEALRRCPNLQTIPYDFEGYSEVSKKLYDIVASYTLDIEAVSCDELYLDCTELLQDIQLSPCQFSSVLRAEIEKETGCTASAGMGSNMLLARLANKVAKPNGQHYVHDSNIEKFMKKQKVGDLPGVGYTFTKKLQSLNVKTCGDLQMWPLSKLQQEFGPKTGQALFHRCRGKDDRIVQCHKHRKSVSAEINYGIRFETDSDVHNFISELACEVQNRVQNIGCKGKSVTLKLMVRKSDAPVETAKFMGHGVCDHFSKSVLLKSATDSSRIISKECCIIARSLKIKPQDYRGIGIQLSKLEYVQREKQNLKGFLNPVNKESSVADMSKDGVFSPKKLKVVNKPIPEKSTIMHFLSNKPSSSSELPNNTNENTLEQGTSQLPNLGGAVKLDDVRNLLKEWIQSTEEPLEEDINDVKKYLIELVNVNLSNVKILLKFLHRMGSKGNEKWKKVYLIILSCLQEKVELKYSVRLEMETNFSL
ncbi:DNA repair protein REV1 [Nephila pilipes]|uniref:DNA repair protein REV1 n=1 Tax=Nephila pilipes TaxID=299642 RepID=A0A8X6P9N7_NEPPI|nr:DNA repair protein REV1 [Nephila pilipes]